MLNAKIFSGLFMAAGIVSAQLADLPTCAVNPALAAIGGQTKCQITDFDCICSDSSLMQSLSSAVQQACTKSSDLETAKSAAAALCATGVNNVAAATTAAGATSAAATGSDASVSAVAGSGSSSAHLTVPTAAPYYAGNATTILYSSGSGVASVSATGSPIAASGPVKAAGAYLQKDKLAVGLVAIVGLATFF